MIALYHDMDPVSQNTVLAREQYAFALNRAGQDEAAEAVLRRVIEDRGPSSETYGLLGRSLTGFAGSARGGPATSERRCGRKKRSRHTLRASRPTGATLIRASTL